uniref:Putative hydrolase C777.06c isoform X2 n=1 Tax=Rhizophora mucronata TaxID=61149 RepID=A0A2P2KVW7_RHIMU
MQETIEEHFGRKTCQHLLECHVFQQTQDNE